jgi:hypothetical protein
MQRRTLQLLTAAPLGLLLAAGDAGAGARVPASKPAARATAKSAQSPGPKGKSRGRRPGRGKKRRHEPPPQMPSLIELTAIELTTGTAHVEVVGTTRPPLTRLFVLTDANGRRFVPSFAECYPPAGVQLPEGAHDDSLAEAAGEAEAGAEAEGRDPTPAGRLPELPATTRWRCALSIPRLYRRVPLTSLAMEWGSLSVSASSDTVQRLWSQARAAAPLSALAERPKEPAVDSPSHSTLRAGRSGSSAFSQPTPEADDEPEDPRSAQPRLGPGPGPGPGDDPPPQ